MGTGSWPTEARVPVKFTFREPTKQRGRFETHVWSCEYPKHSLHSPRSKWKREAVICDVQLWQSVRQRGEHPSCVKVSSDSGKPCPREAPRGAVAARLATARTNGYAAEHTPSEQPLLRRYREQADTINASTRARDDQPAHANIAVVTNIQCFGDARMPLVL